MNRRYDFDWLKTFGAVMVVAAHSTIFFSTWSPNFGNFQKNKLIDELLWNMNLWLMPLFMLLAGASVWYTLQKRSNHEYLRERLLHLGMPMVILVLTFGIPMGYVGQSMLGKFDGSLWDYYAHFVDFFPSNTFHMWFLVYLLIYAVLTLPLFRFLQSGSGLRLIDKLARACQRPAGIYLFFLPLWMVQLALSGGTPLPDYAAPPNDRTRFVFLLLVFVFGYILVSDRRFQEAIARQWPVALTVALATSGIMFAITWQDTFSPTRNLPIDYSSWYAVFWTVFAIGSWSWLVVWLGFGQRFLNVNHPLLKSASAASYPVYLLHPLVNYPVVFLLQEWQANAFIGSFVMTSLVLAGTLALIAIIQRWSFPRLLLGLKTQTRATRLVAHSEKGYTVWAQSTLPVGVATFRPAGDRVPLKSAESSRIFDRNVSAGAITE